jgi:hypothetical protein
MLKNEANMPNNYKKKTWACGASHEKFSWIIQYNGHNVLKT